MRYLLVALLLLALIAGCATPAQEKQQDNEPAASAAAAARPSSTPDAASSATTAATATGTATPLATPMPTLTATPTSTPTATAVPITVAGNPRAAALRAPAAQEGADCGLVDLFDFPLDAPHAREASGGGDDFGIFRTRYDGYHTGEDWWHTGGRHSSLGAPVYSIGHGQVTYAEPLGWGRDKGVVIVRHTFTGGDELLSFYGHLDEDSLKVEAGDCVARGDLLGKIGRPRTSPHLHFELRTVMPLAPGRGYLPDDPTLAGFMPPSTTIWNSRMAVSPGVLWTQPAVGDGIRGVDVSGEGIAIVLGEEFIAGIDTADGDERWHLAVGEDVEEALLDSGGRQIYTANQFGEVTAYALPDTEAAVEAAAALPLWTTDVATVGIPALMPLPGGGLILSAWDNLIAISAEGEPLWEAELETQPYDWLVSGDMLIGTTTGGERPLWTAEADGWQRWDSDAGGKLAAAGDNVLLYNGNALYHLDLETQSVEPLLALPGGRLETGDVAALPGGGSIIAYADRTDRRLVALDGDGDLLWQRSIAESTAGELDLVADGNDLFLLDQNNDGVGSEIALFALDLEEVSLAHLFTGGTRSRNKDQTRLFTLGNGRILISIDGRNLTLLDTREAVSGEQ